MPWLESLCSSRESGRVCGNYDLQLSGRREHTNPADDNDDADDRRRAVNGGCGSGEVATQWTARGKERRESVESSCGL